MAGDHPGSHRPLEARHRWPMVEEGAAQNLQHSGYVGFAVRLAALREEWLWRAAHAGRKAGSTCSRINVRS